MSFSNTLTTQLSLSTCCEQQSVSQDSGLVTFCDDSTSFCLGADEFCPLLEELCEKDQVVSDLRHKLEDAEGRIRQLDGLAKLGELSAVVAHEIRNPLTGISATAEVLLEEISSDDTRRESVEIILEEIQRLEKTVSNLLDFARERKPFITRIDLREQVETVLSHLDALARRHSIVISGSTPLDLPPGFGDPELVQQMFMNIAINAIQAMPNGGELNVRVGLSSKDGRQWVTAQFIDTGCGIAPEQIGRIFDPFFTTKSTGAGLGLAACRRMIDTMRGYITVESEQARGTTFEIGLPVAM